MPTPTYYNNKNILTDQQAAEVVKPSVFKQIMNGYFSASKMTASEKEEKAIIADMINYSEKPFIPGVNL